MVETWEKMGKTWEQMGTTWENMGKTWEKQCLVLDFLHESHVNHEINGSFHHQ